MTDLLEQVAALAELQSTTTPRPWVTSSIMRALTGNVWHDGPNSIWVSAPGAGGNRADEYQANAAFIAAAGSLDFAALHDALSAPTPGAGPANQFKQAICELDNMASLALEDGLLDRAAEYKAASEALAAALSAPAPGAAGGAGPYEGALRIPAGDDLLALSKQLRADAEQTRLRHSIRTAYCAVSIDDLVRYTAAVEAALAPSATEGADGPLTLAECYEAMRLNRMQVAVGRLVEAVDYMLPKVPVRKLDADDEMSIRSARSTGQEIYDELKKVLDQVSARAPEAAALVATEAGGAGQVLEIQGWRSPEEKPAFTMMGERELRDWSDDVLAYKEFGEFVIAYYDFRPEVEGWYVYTDGDGVQGVQQVLITAWQPLPERPAGGQELEVSHA